MKPTEEHFDEKHSEKHPGEKHFEEKHSVGRLHLNGPAGPRLATGNVSKRSLRVLERSLGRTHNESDRWKVGGTKWRPSCVSVELVGNKVVDQRSFARDSRSDASGNDEDTDGELKLVMIQVMIQMTETLVFSVNGEIN